MFEDLKMAAKKKIWQILHPTGVYIYILHGMVSGFWLPCSRASTPRMLSFAYAWVTSYNSDVLITRRNLSMLAAQFQGVKNSFDGFFLLRGSFTRWIFSTIEKFVTQTWILTQFWREIGSPFRKWCEISNRKCFCRSDSI